MHFILGSWKLKALRRPSSSNRRTLQKLFPWQAVGRYSFLEVGKVIDMCLRFKSQTAGSTVQKKLPPELFTFSASEHVRNKREYIVGVVILCGCFLCSCARLHLRKRCITTWLMFSSTILYIYTSKPKTFTSKNEKN